MLGFIQNLDKVSLFLLIEVVQQTRPLIFPLDLFSSWSVDRGFPCVMGVVSLFCSNSLSFGSVREAFKRAMVRPVLKTLGLTLLFYLILDVFPKS